MVRGVGAGAGAELVGRWCRSVSAFAPPRKLFRRARESLEAEDNQSDFENRDTPACTIKLIQ